MCCGGGSLLLDADQVRVRACTLVFSRVHAMACAAACKYTWQSTYPCAHVRMQEVPEPVDTFRLKYRFYFEVHAHSYAQTATRVHARAHACAHVLTRPRAHGRPRTVSTITPCMHAHVCSHACIHVHRWLRRTMRTTRTSSVCGGRPRQPTTSMTHTRHFSSCCLLFGDGEWLWVGTTYPSRLGYRAIGYRAIDYRAIGSRL